MNGDILTTLDFEQLLAVHRCSGAVMTIAVPRRRVDIDLGVIETRDGLITGYTKAALYGDPIWTASGYVRDPSSRHVRIAALIGESQAWPSPGRSHEPSCQNPTTYSAYRRAAAYGGAANPTFPVANAPNETLSLRYAVSVRHIKRHPDSFAT
jgi:hypothetical protein